MDPNVNTVSCRLRPPLQRRGFFTRKFRFAPLQSGGRVAKFADFPLKPQSLRSQTSRHSKSDPW